MSTTALASTQAAGRNTSIMPQEKSTRQIVREEIKRAEELKKLEEKYEAGEISKFEYTAQKYLLNLPVVTELPVGTHCYSTTA